MKIESRTRFDLRRPSLAAFLDRAAAVVRRPLHARRGRAARRGLGAFTDRQLQDLGLARRDIDACVGRPRRRRGPAG